MENAPLHNDIADGPDGGAAHWVKAEDGLQIRIAHWTNADVKATILMFPGRTEYIEKYGRTAGEFLQRGYATVAVDWRGQGLADRTHDNPKIGDVVAFTDYQKDVAAVVAHARALGLPEPFYLVAHSMGGCIGLRALIEGLPVKAAAFSAPMWGIEMDTLTRSFAWAASSLSRVFKFDHKIAPGQDITTYVDRCTFEENTLTTNPDVFALFQAQAKALPDVTLGGPSLRWLNEALREMRYLSTLPSPQLRCVTFLGTDEEIVDPTRIRERMANWHNGTLRVLEGAKHEILMESPEMCSDVMDTLIGIFDRHR